VGKIEVIPVKKGGPKASSFHNFYPDLLSPFPSRKGMKVLSLRYERKDTL
jgi:hypothetical protein